MATQEFTLKGFEWVKKTLPLMSHPFRGTAIPRWSHSNMVCAEPICSLPGIRLCKSTSKSKIYVIFI